LVARPIGIFVVKSTGSGGQVSGRDVIAASLESIEAMLLYCVDENYRPQVACDYWFTSRLKQDLRVSVTHDIV